MPLVQDAAQTRLLTGWRSPQAKPGIRGAAALILIPVIGVALGGCSESGSSDQPQSGAGPRIGAPLRLADCTDWRNADTAERLGTVRALRDFAGGPTGSPAGHGATLPDEQAYRLLQGYCSAPFARAFRLYLLYNRAAGFQSIKEKYLPDE